MTERRQSARSSAVKEREVLEEKLVRRKQAEEVKAQKKKIPGIARSLLSGTRNL